MVRARRGAAAGPRDAQRTVRRQPAGRRRDRLPAQPASPGRQAVAVGAGADGDPRGRTDLSAGVAGVRTHPCLRARRPRYAVGDGRGASMHGPRRGDRRIVGRPGRARLHRHAAPRGGGRAQRSDGVAGAAWRQRQFERRADALAGGKRKQPGAPAQPQSAGRGGVGVRAVPRARVCAGAVERGA